MAAQLCLQLQKMPTTSYIAWVKRWYRLLLTCLQWQGGRRRQGLCSRCVVDDSHHQKTPTLSTTTTHDYKPCSKNFVISGIRRIGWKEMTSVIHWYSQKSKLGSLHFPPFLFLLLLLPSFVLNSLPFLSVPSPFLLLCPLPFFSPPSP